MMRKNVLRVCLTLAITVIALTLFALPSSAAQTSGSCGDSLTWSFDAGSGVLTIEGSGDMTDYKDFASVAPWSVYKASIKSVILPDGLTSIGNYAFYECSALESLTIPESVVRMGNAAFYRCSALTEIRFNAASMEDLSEDNKAFWYAGLSGNGITVTVGAKVTRLPAYLFCPVSLPMQNQPRITALVFEEGSVCQSIGEYAFYYNSELTEVNLPPSVTEIEKNAFRYTGLTKLTFGENLKQIGEGAFDSIYIEQLRLPDSVETVGDYAFGSCSELASIDFGNGVKQIGKAAFELCKGLTEITIPDSVETIGAEAFLGCEGLVSIEFGKGLTTIGTEAFASCEKLTALNLPNSLVTIEGGAFRNCIGFTSLVIPDSVKTIGAGAFYDCNALVSLTIGKGVLDIGNTAFENCRSLTEIFFNATAMNDLYNLTNYTFADAGKDGAGITVTVDANVTRLPAYLFCPYSFPSEDYDPKIVSVVFEEGSACKEIAEYAFSYCRELTAITLPDSLTTIGGGAFENTGLTGIVIPDSVTSLGANAFQDCEALTNAVLGDGLTRISSFLFRSCSSLTDCVFGKNITKIEDQAFKWCTSLTEMEIPSSVTEMGGYVFEDCTNLATVYVSSPELVADMTASWGCGNLTRYAQTVMIDSSITDLPDYILTDFPYSTDTVHNGKNYTAWSKTPIEEAHEHIFRDTWRSDEHTHWNSCKLCAEKQNIAAHEYDGNCDGECNVCGFAREIPHEYDHACDPQCNVCGEWRLTSHVYDHACDPDCNICGETHETAHSDKPDWFMDEENHWLECEYCNAVTLQQAHSWDLSKVTKEATAEEEGEMTYWCDCGASRTEAIARSEAPESEANGNDDGGAEDTDSDSASDGSLLIPIVIAAGIALLAGAAVAAVIVLRGRRKQKKEKENNE